MAGRPEGGVSNWALHPALWTHNFLIVVALAFICFLFQSRQASSHAALISSVPADGAVVATAPKELVLSFNEPVSPLVVKLVRPDGSALPLDRFVPRDTSLTIEMPELQKGTHVLSWRVVSADGHPIGGSLVFSVGKASASGPPGVDAPAGLPIAVVFLLCKIGLYAGLFFGVGGAFFLSWLGPAAGRTGNFVRVMLGTGLLSVPIAVGLQGLDALELPLAAITSRTVWQTGLGTSFGGTALIALAAFAAAFAAIAGRSKAFAQPLAAVALAGVGLALAASGHAANAEPHWLTKPAVFLHSTGIAFWVGALAPLTALLSSGAPESTVALKRFSQWIPLPLGALLLAGAALAIIQVETPSTLFETSYGRVLLTKLCVVSALLALAAHNRWRLTRPVVASDGAASRAMVRAVRFEFTLVVVILAAAALWRFTPPPRVIAIEAAQPATVHLHGEKAMADISIAPGRAGEVILSAFVMTPAFEPLAAKEVMVRFANSAAGVGPIKRSAALVDWVWRVEGVAIPFPGRWTIGLDVLISDFEVAKLEGEVEIRP